MKRKRPVTAAMMALVSTLAAPAFAQTAPAAPAPSPVPINPALITLKLATQLSQDALATCAAKGEHATAVVMDADGFVRIVMSDDNAASVGLTSSMGKANAVLDFKISTRDAQQRLQSDAAFAAQNGKNPRYFFHPGGLPLYRAGKFVAIFAVGGGHDKDEDCAKAALAKVPDLTTQP